MIIKDGKAYVRVSTIAKRFNDYGYTPDDKIQNKSRIGTNVHQAIDCYLKKDVPILTNDDEIGYFNSFLIWRKEVAIDIVCREKRYFDDQLMITGKVDGVAMIPGEKTPILIDYKCAAKEMESWRIQTHLYYHLVTKAGMRLDKRVLVIQLSEKGNAPLAFSYAITDNNLAKCYREIDRYHKEHKLSHKSRSV